MILIEIILAGFIMGFISALPLGPSALEIIRRGVCYGIRPAIMVAIGTVTSDIIYSFLAYYGISNYVLNNVFFSEVAGICAAVIIAILGVYTFSNARKMRDIDFQKSEKTELHPYLAGLAITIFNPYIILFWSGILNFTLKSRLLIDSQNLAPIFIVSAIIGILAWTLILSYLSSLGHLKIAIKYRSFFNQLVGCFLILASLVILIKILLFSS